MLAEISSYSPKVYTEPVSFNCTVDGKSLTASVVEQLENIVDFTFVVKFSDGVVIETTSCENGSWWVDNFKHRRYALAIGDALHNFMSVKTDPWLSFEIQNKGETLLVWVARNDTDGIRYEVNYKGTYQFDLKREKTGWSYRTKSVNAPAVDETIAASVGMMIDALE